MPALSPLSVQGAQTGRTADRVCLAWPAQRKADNSNGHRKATVDDGLSDPHSLFIPLI